MAKQFLEDDTYFNPLAEGYNVLPFEHAYSHVNAFSSAMQAYITLGSEKHLRAARNGFEMVLKTQSFATGGWGPNEAFGEPGTGQLGDSLRTSHASFETPCGAYGHFKIARYLLRTTKEARYGDSMERILYNTILGAWPIQADGTSFYYSDYGTTGRKVWYGNKWPCCSGTFPQLAADYHISTYLRSADGVYVNLFAPSKVRWTEGAATCSLTQETNYPFDSKITIKDVGLVAGRDNAVRANSRVGDAGAPAVGERHACDGRRRARRVRGDPPDVEGRRSDRAGAADAAPSRAGGRAALESAGAAARTARALRGGGCAARVREGRSCFEAKPVGNSGDCTATSADGKEVVMRPFMTIKEESYSTYVQVKV